MEKCKAPNAPNAPNAHVVMSAHAARRQYNIKSDCVLQDGGGVYAGARAERNDGHFLITLPNSDQAHGS
jgi:hypothetical protein